MFQANILVYNNHTIIDNGMILLLIMINHTKINYGMIDNGMIYLKYNNHTIINNGMIPLSIMICTMNFICTYVFPNLT